MIHTIAEETAFILPFQSDQATLPLVGGKGANLARMARAGLPVPEGFLIVTRAYQSYIDANHLSDGIAAALAGPIPTEPGLLEDLSSTIRALFTAGQMPCALADALQTAYLQLGEIGRAHV
jgi:rifampicin phosphotransferase